MKRNLFYALLGVEFAALTALALMTARFSGLFSSLMAFPFEQIGAGLRALSLKSGAGNGLALAIWAGVSLSPLIPAIMRLKDKKRVWENCALCCMAAVLFIALYLMANPGALKPPIPGAGESLMPVMKAIIGGVAWSVCVLWAVLRFTRLFRSGDTNALMGYLRAMLYALGALFTGALALYCAGALMNIIKSERRVNAISLLRALANALPYALNVIITLRALPVLDALLTGKRAQALDAARKLSQFCCASLGITVASVTAINVLQLIFIKHISDVAVSVEIPILSIAFVLAVLLMARLIAENRRLRDDIDLFV